MSEQPSHKNVKTPSKSKNTMTTVSPRELRTPSKVDQPGLPRTVFTHGTMLQGLLENWRRLSEKGTTLCRTILALKLHEYEPGDYPEKLHSLIESLVEAMNGLENVVESIGMMAKQMKAVAQLQSTSEPVIGSWSASHISLVVSEIHSEYVKELSIKKYVAENIVHCRDEAVSEVMASAWEFPVHVNSNNERLLLADLGVNSCV